MVELTQIRKTATWYINATDGITLTTGSLWGLNEDGKVLLIGLNYIRGSGYHVYDIWSGCEIQRFNSKKDMTVQLSQKTWWTADVGDQHLPGWMVYHAQNEWYAKYHKRTREAVEIRRCVTPMIAEYVTAEDLATAMDNVVMGEAG